jgi:hypothetical protein
VEGGFEPELRGRLQAVLAGAELVALAARERFDGLDTDAQRNLALRFAVGRGLAHGGRWVPIDDLALAAWVGRDPAVLAGVREVYQREALSTCLGWGWPDTASEVLRWVDAVGWMRDELLEDAVCEGRALSAADREQLCRKIETPERRLRAWFDLAVSEPDLRSAGWAADALATAAALGPTERVIDRHFWLAAIEPEPASEHWKAGWVAVGACDGVLGVAAALRSALLAGVVTSTEAWREALDFVTTDRGLHPMPDRRDQLLYDAIHALRYARSDRQAWAMHAAAVEIRWKMTTPLVLVSALALLVAFKREHGMAPDEWLAPLEAALPKAASASGSPMVLSKVAGYCPPQWCLAMAPRIEPADARFMWLVGAMAPRRFGRPAA